MFEPTIDAELARQHLEGFKQIGRVTVYVSRFRALTGVIWDISISERYHAFVNDLKPNVRQYIEPIARGDLEAAILMAEQFDLYGTKEPTSSGSGGKSQGGSQKKGDKRKGLYM